MDELGRGETIGRYVVLEPRGRGAMGAVYATYDPELARRVAVKVLRTEAVERQGSEVAHARLLREAQALARLSHPHVVRVFDVGATDDGVFMAMELVEGTDLRHWLAERPRGWAEVVEVIEQAGAGLAAAHALGLVHRDLKPDNVLVADDGRVRVGDFGLARRFDDPDDEPTLGHRPQDTAAPLGLTASGALAGTPAYMAPEQHEGAEADPRSDQYSLCLTLFEALYGRRPFPQEREAMVEAKRKGEGIDGGPVGVAGRVPAAVRAVLRRGLQPVADDRYPRLEPLLVELSRARARASTLRGAVAVAAVAVLCGAGAWGLRSARQTAAPCAEAGTVPDDAWSSTARASVRQRLTEQVDAQAAGRAVAAIDRVVERWTAEHRDACEATWVRGEQSAARLDARAACLRGQWEQLALAASVLAEADRETAERSAEIVHGLPPAAACRDVDPAIWRSERPAPDEDGAADVHHAVALAAVLRRAACYQEAWERLEAYGEPSTKDHSHVDAAALALARAEALDDLGRLEDSERSFHEAVRLARVAGDAQTEADAWLGLASAASERQHDPQRARFFTQMGVAAVESVGGDDRITAWAETLLGSLDFVEGDDEAARRHWERALELRMALFGEEHPLTASSLTNLGGVLYGQGALDDAREMIERGLEIRERLFGPDHPVVAASATNLGLVLAAQGRTAEAVRWHARALEIQRRHRGADHPALIRAHDGLAQALEADGQPEQARAHYEQARALATQHLPAGHPALVSVLSGLAEIDLAGGDAVRAEAEAAEAVAITADDSIDPLTRADVQWLHARALERLGRDEEARVVARRALDHAKSARGSGDELRAEIESWLGVVPRDGG